MFRRALIALVTLTMFIACRSAPPLITPTSPPPTSPPPTATTSPPTATATIAPQTATPSPEPTVTEAVQPTPEFIRGESLPDHEGQFFAAAGTCDACHTDMQDANGVDISTDTLWRSSMMANAARDPYWTATVEREVEINPALAKVIEDKCATCHMPMARTTSIANGTSTGMLGEGYLNPDHDLHTLAMDGVSCTVCHQFEPDNFGEVASFSGGFLFDLSLPTGNRVTYGPFQAAQGEANRMLRTSGFSPVQADHMSDSELCATCHTLYTPFLDADGEVAGEFPEQTPYLEWLNSDYAATDTCQNCHMPYADGAVVLATIGRGTPREPVAEHNFLGANNLMLSILRNNGEELGVTADSDHFDATIARGLAFLQEQTATLSLGEVLVEGNTLIVDVDVQNLAGHKFPTGYPSRRAWLHVTVQDVAGSVIFESGGYQIDGSITGNDNDADPARYEPHYEVITDPDQVQIFEPILGDVAGNVTTTLLFGSQYLKDNRLLPLGWDAAAATPDIMPYGEAASDPSFEGGADTVTYQIALADATGPLTVTVEFVYQSVGYRWANNLRAGEGQLVADFMRFYDAADNRPVVITTVSTEVTP